LFKIELLKITILILLFSFIEAFCNYLKLRFKADRLYYYFNFYLFFFSFIKAFYSYLKLRFKINRLYCYFSFYLFFFNKGVIFGLLVLVYFYNRTFSSLLVLVILLLKLLPLFKRFNSFNFISVRRIGTRKNL
jgi:hypothetical protein